MTIRIRFPAITSFWAAPCKIIVPPIGFAGRSLSIITDSPLSLRRFIASLFSCVSAEIRQNLCAACVLGLHECSNSRPHVCKADFTNFALISLLLFFLLTRCYFIESQHVKTSSASSVVGVVEPSFAPFVRVRCQLRAKFGQLLVGRYYPLAKTFACLLVIVSAIVWPHLRMHAPIGSASADSLP